MHLHPFFRIQPRSCVYLAIASAALLLCASVHAAEGKVLFDKLCASCHGKDGRAGTPAGKTLGAKDLALSKIADTEITKQIVEGRRDEKNVQRMPSFKDKITDEEIKTLVTVVKSFRKLPTDP